MHFNYFHQCASVEFSVIMVLKLVFLCLCFVWVCFSEANFGMGSFNKTFFFRVMNMLGSPEAYSKAVASTSKWNVILKIKAYHLIFLSRGCWGRRRVGMSTPSPRWGWWWWWWEWWTEPRHTNIHLWTMEPKADHRFLITFWFNILSVTLWFNILLVQPFNSVIIFLVWFICV